jgi:hypothetical protein
MSQVTRTIDSGNSAALIRSLLQSKCGVGKYLICTPVCEQPGELGSDTERKSLGTQSAIKIPVSIWFKMHVNNNILSKDCAPLLSCSDS